MSLASTVPFSHARNSVCKMRVILVAFNLTRKFGNKKETSSQ